MDPTTPTRTRDKLNSASPHVLSTPRPTTPSEKSFSDNWWIEREREQEQNFEGEISHSAKSPVREVESMESTAQQSHISSTTSPMKAPRRGHSMASFINSNWSRYPASRDSSVDQGDNGTVSGHTFPIFEDDNTSRSEYGTEQENQLPFDVPSTPPAELTTHRFQRDPLKDLALDRNGRPLHTTSSLAQISLQYPELASATPSVIDEDEEFEMESNSSTVVLPTTRKRSASLLEEDEKENDAAGDHSIGSRLIKRHKGMHHPTCFNSPVVHASSLHMTANPANSPFALSTLSNYDADRSEKSDSESIASTVCLPAPRKRASSHLESDGQDDESDVSREGSARARVTKRRKTVQVGSLPGIDSRKAISEQNGDHITSRRTRPTGNKFPRMPATGQVHTTNARPQPNHRLSVQESQTHLPFDKEALELFPHNAQPPISGITAPPSSPVVFGGDLHTPSFPRSIMKTRLRLHDALHFPTPAKTPTALLFSQQPCVHYEPESMNNIMGRLDEAEAGFNRWLAEVRNKKSHYRRITAQQQADRRAIEDDMARLVALGPIIQAMAAEELHEVDEAIRVEEGHADRLSEKRRELRHRVLSFEKLRHDLGEERRAGL